MRIGVTGVGSGLTLLQGVMPGVAPIGASLGGVHQGIIDWQFRYPVVLSGLVDKTGHLLPHFRVVRQTGAVPTGGGLRSGRGYGADRQRHAPAFPSAVGCGDLCAPLRLGDGYPEGQQLSTATVSGLLEVTV